MTINPPLVPNNDDFARVGGFVLDEAKTNLAGLIDIYNKAEAEGRLFVLLVAMAETLVQKFHLRDDPEAVEAFKTDIAEYHLRGAIEGFDDNNETDES